MPKATLSQTIEKHIISGSLLPSFWHHFPSLSASFWGAKSLDVFFVFGSQIDPKTKQTKQIVFAHFGARSRIKNHILKKMILDDIWESLRSFSFPLGSILDRFRCQLRNCFLVRRFRRFLKSSPLRCGLVDIRPGFANLLWRCVDSIQIILLKKCIFRRWGHTQR